MIIKYREVVCDECQNGIVHLKVRQKLSDYGIKKINGKILCEECKQFKPKEQEA